MREVELRATLGETRSRTLRVVNGSGQPVDLAGITLTFKVREVGGTSDLISLPLVIGSPTTTGKATLNLTATSIASLSPQKQYVYRVQTQAPTTIIKGAFIVETTW